MAVPLRVLILEDEPADAELVVHALASGLRAGLEARGHGGGLRQVPGALARRHPRRSPLAPVRSVRALARLRERGLDVPFVIVSGAIGEDVAVGLRSRGRRLRPQAPAGPARPGRAAGAGAGSGRETRSDGPSRGSSPPSAASGPSSKRAPRRSSSSARGPNLYSSPSSSRVLRYAPEELVGRNLIDIMHP